jgi:hypothetical protein
VEQILDFFVMRGRSSASISRTWTLRVEFIGRHQAHRLPLMLARSLIPGTAASMASIVTAPEV